MMMVETKVMREAIERKDVDLRTLAVRLGLLKYHRNPAWPPSGDIGALKRYLGITKTIDHKGNRDYRKHLQERTAIRILNAADIDPWEVGL